MFDWWSTLGRALQIFYGIAITTSAVMLFQLVLMFFGMDGDSDFDVDDIDDHGTGGILSVRTVSAFFVGFGWTGVAAIEAGWTVTEVGRQPWIIRGVMRTSEAVTPMPGIQTTFLLYTLMYVFLATVTVAMLVRLFRQAPEVHSDAT